MKSSHAAFAATALLVLATPGVAATAKTVSTTVKPNITGKVTAIKGAGMGEASNTNDILTMLKIDRFDGNLGILVGARVSADMRVSAFADGYSYRSPGQVSATYRPQLGGTGFTAIAGPILTNQWTCSDGACRGSPTGTNSGRIVGSADIAVEALSNYVGTTQGELSLKASGEVKATKTSDSSGRIQADGRVVFGTPTTSVKNEVTMTYSYLDFATPSFSSTDPTVRSLALDFGTLTAGSAARTLNFSLNNIGNDNTAGLSLKSITTTGSGFTTTLATFANGLAGGQSGTYSVTLDPTMVGAFDQSLALTFEDYAPGGVGVRSYTMNLRAFGSVEAAVVPEPASWAMMIAGFGLVGIVSRRKPRAIVRFS